MFAPTSALGLDHARDGFAVRFWGALAADKQGCCAVAQDGSITLTSGMLAHQPMQGGPIATAVGGAVEHPARGLAIDLAPVQFDAVCPGLILTERREQMMPKARLRLLVAPLPVRCTRWPAEAYVYLMLNRYETAQILPVDGVGW